MTYNELRKDYLLNRWVVIATERGRRPTDFAAKERQKVKQAVCPMCPGHEDMTPPATLVYLQSGNRIEKTADESCTRIKNWLVRTIPNLFPAFSPPKEMINLNKIMKSDNLAAAIGHHEVVVESPNHDEHPAEARIPQLTLVVKAYVDRLRELSTKPYVKYVSIFRNHGIEAGASLSHAHSQLISTPFIPTEIAEEQAASQIYWKKNHECPYCNILDKETDGPRLILNNQKYVAFAPYASVNPMEFWIIPKKHAPTILNFTQNDMQTLAETMHSCLEALSRLTNDPPYNYGFHISLDNKAKEYFHWHLEVYPNLAIWAGFEKSTRMYINTITPEIAAENMRKTIQS
jgi:UDPglucose--hexose-1-phosphate uridylyltransferase